MKINFLQFLKMDKDAKKKRKSVGLDSDEQGKFEDNKSKLAASIDEKLSIQQLRLSQKKKRRRTTLLKDPLHSIPIFLTVCLDTIIEFLQFIHKHLILTSICLISLLS